MNQLLFVVGPTATGKTSLALALAEKFNGELISADSRQVFKGLDIATGKDIPASQIHGYDLVEPNQDWNVTDFQKFANKTIKEIHERGKLPIIVGGTGLYVKSLLEPFSPTAPPNPELRKKLEKLSVLELQENLQKLDRKKFGTMNHSDQRNPHRLIRAIEISSSSVKPKKVKSNNFDSFVIGLKAPIEILEAQINARVQKRILQNPKAELEYLLSLDPDLSSSAATSLGYKDLQDFYQDHISKERLINLWTIKERQYAKRQLTWFKKQKNINWFDVSKSDYLDKVVDLVSNWYSAN